MKNQPLALWIMLYKNNLPNELIIKILYEFKGLCHPLAIEIENGLGWTWSDQIHNFKKYTYSQRSLMFLKGLNKARFVIKQNLGWVNTQAVTCVNCGWSTSGDWRGVAESDYMRFVMLINETIALSCMNMNPERWEGGEIPDWLWRKNTYFIDERNYNYWCQILQDIHKTYKIDSDCDKTICIKCFNKLKDPEFPHARYKIKFKSFTSKDFSPNYFLMNAGYIWGPLIGVVHRCIGFII